MMQGRLQQVTAHYKQQLLHHEVQAEHALVEAHQHTLAQVQAHLVGLYHQIATAGQSGGHVPVSRLFDVSRLQSAKHFIITQLDHYGVLAQQATQHLLQQGVLLGQQAAQAQLHAVSGVWTFTPPSPGVIHSLVGATRAGSPLSDLFNGFGSEAAKGASEALIRGVTLGSSVQQIAREVQQALDVSRYRALTIARTETLRAFRTANLDTYQASGLVQAWQWTASLSARTCAACIAMDGSIHDLSEPMDSHVNCRCTMTPVLIGATVTNTTRGADWFDNQDESVQQAILGSAGYDLYRSGQASLHDFVGVRHDAQWGSSIYVKSVRQLKKGA